MPSDQLNQPTSVDSLPGPVLLQSQTAVCEDMLQLH